MADSCGAVDVSVSGGLDPFLGKASPLDPYVCEVDTLRCEPEKFSFLYPSNVFFFGGFGMFWWGVDFLKSTEFPIFLGG